MAQEMEIKLDNNKSNRQCLRNKNKKKLIPVVQSPQIPYRMSSNTILITMDTLSNQYEEKPKSFLKNS